MIKIDRDYVPLLILLSPYDRGHDDQYHGRELYQGLDGQLVHIAVHCGQKQHNAPRKERIPQLTGIGISANKRPPLRVHTFSYKILFG